MKQKTLKEIGILRLKLIKVPSTSHFSRVLRVIMKEILGAGHNM